MARMPEPQPTSSTRAPSRPPAIGERPRARRGTAASSGGARSRRPCPGRGPGRRRPAARRWRRQVGRMTSRRPTRRTGKCAFQASAQSSSWTTRVRRSPIGAQPERLEVAERLGDARRRPPRPRPRRARAGSPRTMAGRVGSTRAPRPSSTRSNAGSTVVPPVATRPRISLTASTASRSASTASSSQAPGPRDRSSRARPGRLLAEPALAADRPRRLLGRVRLEQLALLLRQLRRDDDVDEDVEVAARRRRGGGAARPCRAAGSRCRAGCRA